MNFDIMNLTLKEYINGIQSGDLDSREVVDSYLEKVSDEKINAYVRTHQEYIDENLDEFENKKLAGAPIAIKDIILTKDYVSSCGSKMLEDFQPPYSASCFKKLEKDGGLMIGKANMDEFAMGGSGETSYFDPTYNPHGENRVPGGSSSGSAAAVAADLAIAALGTDTGGSVRQPASLCGVVGLKPTYGRVSRYGVQAMASSLDQVGPITKTVEDSKILLKSIAGYDDNDANSVDRDQDFEKWDQAMNAKDLQDTKIALPEQFFQQGLDENVENKVMEAIDQAKELGATVERVDMPVLKHAIAAYYIIMPAEVSTNLGRMDGIRFGHQLDSFDFDDIHDYYTNIREQGFGDEVKRRVMLGTYVLSAGYYDAYYKKAQKIRQKIKNKFDEVFEEYDAVLGPVSPSVAWKMGEKNDDPVQMYLSDTYTVPANLAGLPGMSLPIGTVKDQGEDMPVGLHILADQFAEDQIFKIGKVLEDNI